MTYQRAYFPMKVINLTQGYGSKSSSHKTYPAIDIAGKDSGKDEIYAPFDCKITKLYQPKDTKKHANTVWLTSTKKVLCPNGYYGYLTVTITHPSEITNMKLGTTYRQGDYLCHEGMTGNATGNHIHVEVAIGKNKEWGNKYNRVKPEEYLFIYEDAILKNNIYKNKKYNFIKESNITYKVNSSDGLNMRTGPSTNYKIIKLLNNDTELLKFYNKGNWSYIYNNGNLGYASNRYLKK